ncbi:MAG TPA: glycosyltransferase family 4 protein, partial [Solirubrobacterales bacterium]|nr:glycosyltransferase family 4 protein [Solirubrobacterales bacterium]
GSEESLADLLEEAVGGYGGTLRAEPDGAAGPDLAIVHGEPGEHGVRERLDRLQEAAGPDPFPLTLVHGVDAAAGSAEVLTAVEDFLEDSREDLELVHVPGLGGTAILVSPRRLEGDGGEGLARLLDGWRLSGQALAQLAAVDAERVRAQARAEELGAELEAARAGLEVQAEAGREALRERLEELAEREAELTATLARREARLATLEAGAIASGESLLDVSPEPAVVDRLGGPGDEAPDEEALLHEGKLRDPLAIAYVLPGLAPGGSGGSHSVVQEARALVGLGARVRVLVESGSGERARQLYPEAVDLFGFYDSTAELEAALEGFDVVVATEAPSARTVAAYADGRPGVLGAYYVQDYEPLFSPAGGPSADAALLSYRQAGGLLLFAKTHWIANVIGTAHGLSVAKVRPSLDRDTFHARGRSGDPARPRVLAMVRPRTPRRRPAQTLAALARLKAELGDGVECLAFGSEPDELAALPSAPGVDHLGLLSRAEVAEVLRRCDLFLDLSAYQAFGRTGLEAMACGAVPVLPIRGGVSEYAEHERNAVLVDTEDEEAVIAAARALLSDRERLERLRAAGIETAESFSVRDAALSQYACFAANHPRGKGA